jgi:uncharacterized RDD family membrane protein YckC
VVLEAVPAGQGHAVVAAAVALVLALTLLPQGILLVRRGQTLGKWMMGIAIRRPDGSLPRPARILLRRAIPVGVLIHLPLVLALAILLAGIDVRELLALPSQSLLRALVGAVQVLATIDIVSIFRADERCVHDLVADTVVVVARGA